MEKTTGPVAGLQPPGWCSTTFQQYHRGLTFLLSLLWVSRPCSFCRGLSTGKHLLKSCRAIHSPPLLASPDLQPGSWMETVCEIRMSIRSRLSWATIDQLLERLLMWKFVFWKWSWDPLLVVCHHSWLPSRLEGTSIWDSQHPTPNLEQPVAPLHRLGPEHSHTRGVCKIQGEVKVPSKEDYLKVTPKKEE